MCSDYGINLKCQGELCNCLGHEKTIRPNGGFRNTVVYVFNRPVPFLGPGLEVPVLVTEAGSSQLELAPSPAG
jgi:hypothetical protein